MLVLIVFGVLIGCCGYKVRGVKLRGEGEIPGKSEIMERKGQRGRGI